MVSVASVISGYLFLGLFLLRQTPADPFPLTFICDVLFFKTKTYSLSHVNFKKNIFSFYLMACLDISLFVQLFLPYSSNKSSKVRHATYIGGEVPTRCVLAQYRLDGCCISLETIGGLRNCTWFDWGFFFFCTLRIRSVRRGFEYMGKKSSFVLVHYT